MTHDSGSSAPRSIADVRPADEFAAMNTIGVLLQLPMQVA
jgi:hypothetical protein